MNQSYENMLSPLTVRGRVLKNRLLQSKCSLPPMSLDGLEDFYLRAAESGAAAVTVWVGDYPGRSLDNGPPPQNHDMKIVSMLDPEVRAAYSGLLEKLHAMGTLVSANLMDVEPRDVTISAVEDWDAIPMTGDYNSSMRFKAPEISPEGIEALINEFVYRCRDLYSLGFDMVTFYASYRASLLANSLSPLLNQRKDKYGGKTMAQRARLTLELFRRVRESCPGLIIEMQISGEEEYPGYTVADWLEYCKMCEGLVDIFQVRGYDGSSTHVCGFNMQPHCPPNLRFAEAFKKAGIKALVSPVGGFGDPGDIERFISEGRTDLVSMARQFICETEYTEKLLAGQSGDITPCLLCNGCHGGHRCAVEPVSLNRKKTYAAKPERSKKVAVIGGGPAGLQAALTAHMRGHRVTLFERSDALGGQLKIAAMPDFKWPLRDYRDWLIKKVCDAGLDIRLNTAASPEALAAEKYDAVICALGSAPKSIPVRGADSDFVWSIDEAYLHEQQLGERVVVIGGASTGRETALYLARKGHRVTMLTRTQAVLFRDLHAQHAEEEYAENTPNFSYIEHASVKEIQDGRLVCEVKTGIPHVALGFGGALIPGHMEFDQSGAFGFPIAVFDESKAVLKTMEVEFDSLVISGGRQPLDEAARAFEGCAPEFFIVGDNVKAGGVRECNESAYDAAMRL